MIIGFNFTVYLASKPFHLNISKRVPPLLLFVLIFRNVSDLSVFHLFSRRWLVT